MVLRMKNFNIFRVHWKIRLLRGFSATFREAHSMKCPNTELFLICIFLYSDWIQEHTDQKELGIWTLFTQWLFLTLPVTIPGEKRCLAFIKPFESPQWSVKIKMQVDFYFNITFWNAQGERGEVWCRLKFSLHYVNNESSQNLVISYQSIMRI